MTDKQFEYQRAACLSRGIAPVPNLALISRSKKQFSTLGLNADWQLKPADLIVDWGNKRFEITSKYRSIGNKQVLCLEDGFIRSLGLGVEGSRPLSIISDWTGIYYDARRPSDLENILAGHDPRSEQLVALSDRADQCIQRIREHHICKYNHAPDLQLPATNKRRILLIDQTFGDLSISAGLASQKSFDRMLADALTESESEADIEILIKTHPDVIAGKKQGYLVQMDKLPSHVQLIAESANPVSIIKQVDEVRVATSQMGFEACLLGKPVRCYGLPFYAGWGITEDHQECSRRTRKRSVQEVFSAAYLLYTHYIHPETGELTDIETVLSHIERQKAYWQQNRGHFICIGFERWKHSYVRNYLRSDSNHIEFAKELNPEAIEPETKVVVWGSNISRRSKDLAATRSLPLTIMEDGFIRSINLGKYGTEPRSLVVDKGGIYFDPESPSDLEHLLNNSEFSEAELETARRIKQLMTEQKISKYNIGSRQSLAINAKPNQKVILVPGQVGIDASIARGCNRIATNIDLLKEVRKLNPDAYLLFKPHPDVVSGNIEESPEDYQSFADQIETTLSIHSCLEVANEIHTMTSLVGFEALMLEKTVHTYGRPFYAGWGLTEDHSTIAMPGRQKALKLEELIAGTLNSYPRYIHPQTGEFTTAESTLLDMSKELQKTGAAKLNGRLISRWLLKARYGGLGILRSWLSK